MPSGLAIQHGGGRQKIGVGARTQPHDRFSLGGWVMFCPMRAAAKRIAETYTTAECHSSGVRQAGVSAATARTMFGAG
jgi:hypothetical protein